MHRLVFTDGACSPNPGIGGWGAVILNVWEEPLYYLSGGVPETTNNEMELMALVASLASIPPGYKVDVVTDSKYLCTNFDNQLIDWAKYGFMTKSGSPVKNISLWKALFDLSCNRDVNLHWIKGHSGHMFNNIADKMAVNARVAIAEDGYDKPNPFVSGLYESMDFPKGKSFIGKGKVFMNQMGSSKTIGQLMSQGLPSFKGFGNDLGAEGGDKTVISHHENPSFMFDEGMAQNMAKALYGKQTPQLKDHDNFFIDPDSQL